MRAHAVVLVAVAGATPVVTHPIMAQIARDSVRLKEIVVVASRSAEPARVRASAADAVSAGELARRQITRLSDALRLLPGSAMVTSGAPGGVTSTFFRGVNSNQTLLLLDGIRVNDANALSQSLLGGLDLAAGDRLEVVRGPQGTLYGGAAIGGVIAIASALPEHGTTYGAETEAGTFAALRGRAHAAVRTGRFGFAGSAGFVDTDNERPNNQYDQRTQQLKIEYRGANAIVGGTFRGLQQFYRSPGDIRTTNTTPIGTTTFENNLGTTFVELRPGHAWSSRLTGGLQGYFVRGRSEFDGFEFISRTKATRWVLDWQHRWLASPRIMAVGGVNAEWETVTDPDGAKDERLRAGYGQVTVHPTDDLTITGGMRYDDYTTFRSALTGRITGSYYFPLAGTKLRATVGSGFLPPSLAARYGSAFQRANPDIKPERSTGWDVGADQFLARGRAVISATVFGNSLRDLIGFENAAFPALGRSINIDRARTRGLELSGRVELGQVDVRTSYTYLDADNLTASSPADRRLIRRPAHSITADAAWQPARWTFGAGLVAALDREDVDFNQFPSVRVNPGDYGDARIYAARELGAGLTVRLRVENLFNNRYEDAYGFPALGRRVVVGLGFDR